MKMLIDSGFSAAFCRCAGVRLLGIRRRWQPARPRGSYRKEDDGGIIVDMLCHWRDAHNLFGEVKGVSCIGATRIPQRWDEPGREYRATADDAAYAAFELGRARARSVDQ